MIANHLTPGTIKVSKEMLSSVKKSQMGFVECSKEKRLEKQIQKELFKWTLII